MICAALSRASSAQAGAAPESEPGSRQDWVRGGGALSHLVRELDWSQTPLGPIDEWPQSLKIAVRILLTSRFAMWMSWGPELTFLYNDAYAKMTLGKKHPWALGKPSREVWKEIWDDIGPRIERVLAPARHMGRRLSCCSWSEAAIAKKPITLFPTVRLPNDDGKICGHLCVVTEETDRVIGERRLNTLRSLSGEFSQANTEQDVDRVARVLAENQRDLPFTLTYLFQSRRMPSSLVEDGIPERSSRCTRIDRSVREESPRGLLRKSSASEISSSSKILAKRFASIPSGLWPEPPSRAILLPITSQTQDAPAGAIVVRAQSLSSSRRQLCRISESGRRTNRREHLHRPRLSSRRRNAPRRWPKSTAPRLHSSATSAMNFALRLTLMLGPLQELLSAARRISLPTADSKLEMVNRNGARLLRLVNTLLDFSRIEAGRVQSRLSGD